MALSFSVSDTMMTPLWDYGWFDLTRFKVEGPSAERKNSSHILSEFLLDPISQRSFCSPGPWGDSVQRHGPFPRERLVADWFRPIAHEEFAKRVLAALDDPDFTEPPSREQHGPERPRQIVTRKSVLAVGRPGRRRCFRSVTHRVLWNRCQRDLGLVLLPVAQHGYAHRVSRLMLLQDVEQIIGRAHRLVVEGQNDVAKLDAIGFVAACGAQSCLGGRTVRLDPENEHAF